MNARRILSSAQGVEAAAILFELNTEPAQLERLGTESGLLTTPDTPAQRELFLRQWYGFVHAAVVAGLMVHAPNIVVATYLHSTRYLLKARQQNDDMCETFIDTVFSPYMDLLIRERQQECPALFFRQVCGLERVEDAPPRALAIISAAMAMTLGAIQDKLEHYDIQSE